MRLGGDLEWRMENGEFFYNLEWKLFA